MTAQLEALFADAITSDYEEGQERKVGTSRVIAAIVGATTVTFLLGVALVDTQQNASVTRDTNAELISRIDDTQLRIATIEIAVAQSAKDLQAATQAKLAGTSLGDQLSKRLVQLNAAAGFTSVTGLGVSVTLSDAIVDPLNSAANSNSGRVVDRDLQMVVNGLWQAGATAISINDQRITSNSAIRAAGSAILVNYRPLIGPYKVVAISKNADVLAGRFRENQGGLLLEELELRYGIIWQLETIGEVTLPAAINDIGGSP